MHDFVSGFAEAALRGEVRRISLSNQRPLALLAAIERALDERREEVASGGEGFVVGVMHVRQSPSPKLPRSRKRAASEIYLLRQQLEVYNEQLETLTPLYLDAVREKAVIEVAVKRLTERPGHVLADISHSTGRKIGITRALDEVKRITAKWSGKAKCLKAVVEQSPEEDTREFELALQVCAELMAIEDRIEKLLR